MYLMAEWFKNLSYGYSFRYGMANLIHFSLSNDICICISFEIVRLSCLFFVVCFQDQRMKHLLKSYTKPLKTTNASASQSCLAQTLPLTTMPVM